MKTKSQILLSIAALCLTACVTPYTPIPYDRELVNIQKILVVESALPEKPTTQKLANNGQNVTSAAGASGGIAGLLVGVIVAGLESGIEHNQRKRIWAILDTHDFDGEEIFDQALEAALTDAGYVYEEITIERDTKGALIAPTGNTVTTPNTAILDVHSIGYGYQRIGGKTQWRPFMDMTVRLIDSPDSKTPLMENKITYNPVGTPDTIVNLPVDAQYAFENIKDMEANPERTIKGLEAAIVSTANAAAQLLK